MKRDFDKRALANQGLGLMAALTWEALRQPAGHQHRLAVAAERAGTTVGTVRKYVREWAAAGLATLEGGVARLPKEARALPPAVTFDCGGCYVYVGYHDEPVYWTVDRCKDARHPTVTMRRRYDDTEVPERADAPGASPAPGTALAKPAAAPPSAFASARTALAEARTTVEAKDVHDKAEGLRAYARLAGDRSLEIEAAEIRIRAARRLGELLDGAIRLPSEGRPQISVPPTNTYLKLDDIGVTRKLSMYAQKLASLSDTEFEEVLTHWRARVDGTTERVTTTVARELERRRRDESLGTPPPLPAGKYRVIYADPPWTFTGGQGRAPSNHYPTLAGAEIQGLNVATLAADDAALILWCPCAHVPLAIETMEAWGFRYKTVAFVWVKSVGDDDYDVHGRLRMGMGHWTRMQTELALLGTRGRVARRSGATAVEQIVRAPAGAHSAKPAETYERIERLLNGPYIELFARGDARPGWDTWGLEAKR